MILAGLLLAFALGWWLCRRLDFYSLVDLFWSGCFLPVVWLEAQFSSGWPARRWLIAALIALWSLRLTLHLGRRLFAHWPQEDRRYSALKEAKGSRWPVWSFLFFQGQALVAWVLTRPFAGIAASGHEGFGMLEGIGFFLLAVAVFGEGLADWQLSRWRREHPGRLCRAGLWSWSRHPNYFFQLLLWFAVLLCAIPSGSALSASLCFVMMTHLVLRVTGVPLAEALSARRYGEEFARYQREVSVLVPMPPRRALD